MDKRGKFKILLILVSFILVVSFSYIVISQGATGQFIIGNEPPYVVNNTFAIKDGANSGDWDNVFDPVIDTHDKDTKFRFNVKDSNPDVLNVRLCIGTAINPSTTGDCNVVNYNFPIVAPGIHSPSLGAPLTYTYNTNPTGTLEGIAETISLSSLDCSGGFCSKTFYIDVIVDDNSGEITTTPFTFNLINNAPSVPSSLNPSSTHDPTPDLTWTAVDIDDGSKDKWPADTLTYYAQIGASSFGSTDYLNSVSAVPAASGASFISPIPWGTPGVSQAVTSTFARIWSTDNFNITSSNYEATLNLIDNLPTFVDIHLSDEDIIAGEASCTVFLPNSCAINPTQGNYSSINMILSVKDVDADCSSFATTSQLTLCLVNSTSLDTCTPTSNNFRTYNIGFNAAESSADNCNYTLSILSGDSQGIEFFRLPGVYKMYLSPVASQAGASISWSSGYLWEYVSLIAPFYTDTVYLGDRQVDGGDGIQLNQWNPGLSLATMTNKGNILINLEWEATDPSSDGSTCDGKTATCWDLSSDLSNALQIDDDNIQETDSSNLFTANIVETPSRITFGPFGGLSICDSINCNSPSLNETLNTYFHINPPTGLSPGTYNTQITFTV